jgi:hypothetical protein
MNIVGNYSVEPFGDVHGFLYDGTTFTEIVPPGSTVSEASGIEGGNIVGSSGGHGFLFDGATYSTLDHPLAVGGAGTFPQGISGGNIVGWYSAASGQRAFLYDGVDWLPLDFPGSLESAAYRIDGINIVGEYEDASGLHGFLYDGTDWTSLDAPGSVTTSARGIDGTNIVGQFYNGSAFHGFLFDGTTWTTLDYPGAASTSAWGIQGNRIVGAYQDEAGNSHGFLAILDDDGLPGDYNENGVVDAADYTVWRDRLGSPVSLPNDDTDGVGLDDYDRWKANFGATLPAAGGGSGLAPSALTTAVVPEPGTLVLIGTVAVFFGRRAGRAGMSRTVWRR